MGNKSSIKLEDSIVNKQLISHKHICDWGYDGYAICLDYEPIQNILAIGTTNGIVKICGATGCNATLKHKSIHDEMILSISFLRGQGRIVVFTSAYINVWDLQSLKCTHIIDIETAMGVNISCSLLWNCYNDRYIYIGTNEGHILLFNTLKCELSSYVITRDMSLPNVDEVKSCGVVDLAINSIEESYLLIAYEIGIVILWDLQNKKVHRQYDGLLGLRTICWNKNGTHFAAGFHSGEIQIWKRRDAKAPLRSFYIEMDINKRCPIYKCIWKQIKNNKKEVDELYIAGGSDKSGIYCWKTVNCVYEKNNSESFTLSSQHSLAGTAMNFLLVDVDPTIPVKSQMISMVGDDLPTLAYVDSLDDDNIILNHNDDDKNNNDDDENENNSLNDGDNNNNDNNNNNNNSDDDNNDVSLQHNSSLSRNTSLNPSAIVSSGKEHCIISVWSNDGSTRVNFPKRHTNALPLFCSFDIQYIRHYSECLSNNFGNQQLYNLVYDLQRSLAYQQRSKTIPTPVLLQRANLWPTKGGSFGFFDKKGPNDCIILTVHKTMLIKLWLSVDLSTPQLINVIDYRNFLKDDEKIENDTLIIQYAQLWPQSRHLCIGFKNGLVLFLCLRPQLKVNIPVTPISTSKMQEETKSTTEDKHNVKDIEQDKDINLSTANDIHSNTNITNEENMKEIIKDNEDKRIKEDIQQVSKANVDDTISSSTNSNIDNNTSNNNNNINQVAHETKSEEANNNNEEETNNNNNEEEDNNNNNNNVNVNNNNNNNNNNDKKDRNSVSTGAMKVCNDIISESSSKKERVTSLSQEEPVHQWELQCSINLHKSSIKDALYDHRLKRLTIIDEHGNISITDVLNGNHMLWTKAKSLLSKQMTKIPIIITYLHIGPVKVSEDAFTSVMYAGLSDGGVLTFRPTDGRMINPQARYLISPENKEISHKPIRFIETVNSRGEHLSLNNMRSNIYPVCLLYIAGNHLYAVETPNSKDKIGAPWTIINYCVLPSKDIITASLIRHPDWERQSKRKHYTLATINIFLELTIVSLMNFQQLYHISLKQLSPNVSLKYHSPSISLNQSATLLILSRDWQITSHTMFRCHKNYIPASVFDPTIQALPTAKPLPGRQRTRHKQSIFNTLFGSGKNKELGHLFEISHPYHSGARVNIKGEEIPGDKRSELLGDMKLKVEKKGVNDNDQITQLKSQSNRAQNKMSENVSKARENLEKVRQIEDRSDQMKDSANQFLDMARLLKNKYK